MLASTNSGLAGGHGVKRWVVILLVALAMLVLLSPGIIGRMAEQGLEDNIALARVESPEITISTENFARGWFTSEGRHRIELSDRSAFPELATFVNEAGYSGMPALILDSRIDHGLVPLASMNRDGGSLQPGIARMATSLQLDPGSGELIDLPGRMYSTIGLSGSADVVLVVGEGNWADGDTTIGWQGADLLLTMDHAGFITSIAGFVAPIRFSAGNRIVTSERIDVTAEQSKTNYDFRVGSLHVQSQGMSVTDPFGGGFGYSSIEARARSDIDDDKLSGATTLDINGLGVPAFGTFDIGLDVAYRGFDAESFTRLYRAFEKTASQGRPEDAFAALYPSMDSELRQFLAAGAELRFDRLNISLPQGDVIADFVFSLPESGTGDAFSWPGLLLKLKATINLTVSTEIMEIVLELQPEAGMMVAMGFLVLQGDEYKMNLEYAQGLATVNGVPMPVPMPGT